jgi:hypothetical protein
MKRKSLFLPLLIILWVLSPFGAVKLHAAQSDNVWEGTYYFVETFKRGGGNVGRMAYEIRIYRQGNRLLADLDVDGWQTTQRLRSYARREGNRVHLYLTEFGEDDQTGQLEYKVGSLLLILEQTFTGNRRELLTHWRALKPMDVKNQASGKHYFQMTEIDPPLARTDKAGNEQPNIEAMGGRYFVRLFNCDDSCWVNVNDGFAAATGFAQDTGWFDLTEALEDVVNKILFGVKNESKGIAYGFQVRRDETVSFEQICGNAGKFGCERNRQFPIGVVREFTYTIQRLPTERTASYSKWLTFLSEFRAAVGRRDKLALRKMIAVPFETQEGQLRTFGAVMRFLGSERR